ncbi:hypothetical protein LAC81_11795 [Ensifer adhaerens]|uniref:hypothetical protein n=1 Tax=Ensifer adhaerens TaxID=106592 RepID=UPI001CC09487|nr:hypothetical protein [Ensifer adhaerens]MBZ7922471.1 hypothetical protein [Ensifer adhaerens]UAX91099.1 hypothetical protein LAC78_11790 [Ensifer adhaerens]UAX98727.1 hypothetical protein LAC80_11795 [Ensifer adhaerens]UAY06109.1 hypothetical protein LAC81_11795 [Ensifer adhaerens]
MAETPRPFVYRASGITTLRGRTMDQDTLERIAATLNAASTNYSVFLKLYEVKAVEPTDSVALVQMALGAGATLGGIEEAQAEAVWPGVKDALLYVGDAGAGPSRAVFESEQFMSLVERLEKQVDTTIKTSTKVESFWLKAGHPAYPVFWDFALIFRREAGAVIFMGASSD